jgi:CheY-like chemotaxis protein
MDPELTLEALELCQLANQIGIACDGVDALDHLYSRGARDTGEHAVALLDLKLPKVGGLDVPAQTWADPLRRQIPIVMLTSSREERDVVRSYQLGVDAFRSSGSSSSSSAKPFGISEYSGRS